MNARASSTVTCHDLRECLRVTRPPADPTRGNVRGAGDPRSIELQRTLESAARPAAVLVPVFDRRDGPSVLFTERAAHLRRHPGQVSFPGGGLERGDADPCAAALREAREEIGLAPERVDVLGYLGPQLTVSGYAVTPVVGLVGAGFRARPDPAEVAGVFEVPLAHFLDPANLRSRTREWRGACFEVAEFDWDEHLIWGATASMLLQLRDLVEK